MGVFGSKYVPERDIPDLTGRVAIVTGGNAGLGLHTVKHLAKKGARVYLAARNESKATGAIAQLEAEGVPKGSVVWLKLDLRLPKDAKASALDFLSREKRLDILVNNAAMLDSAHDLTEDGIADLMSTNHVSPFVFTAELLPLLYKTAREPNSDVRIVNVSSEAHRVMGNDVRFNNIQAINQKFEKTLLPQMSRYAYSKLANILFTTELQRRIDKDGVPIIAVALHPGGVSTDGARSSMGKLPVIKFIVPLVFSLFFMTPDQGSYTSLFAATSPTVHASPEKYKGKYLVPYTTLKVPTAAGNNPELARELWETTETVLAGLL